MRLSVRGSRGYVWRVFWRATDRASRWNSRSSESDLKTTELRVDNETQKMGRGARASSPLRTRLRSTRKTYTTTYAVPADDTAYVSAFSISTRRERDYRRFGRAEEDARGAPERTATSSCRNLSWFEAPACLLSLVFFFQQKHVPNETRLSYICVRETTRLADAVVQENAVVVHLHLYSNDSIFAFPS